MNDNERRQALADFLRTRRAHLTPADVNLPNGSRRRTPGLRREELAQLANIGTSWYVSLEQGRDVRPSEQVLESLAVALRLSYAERRHLFVLAQPHELMITAPPEEIVTAAHLNSIHALNPHPAYIMGKRWDLLAWNKAAELVFAFSEIAPPHSRNFLWRCFTSPVLRSHSQWDKLAESLIAQFRADSARFPGDKWFSELIDDLNQSSEVFRLGWAKHDVKGIPDGHKSMNHPELGNLEFEHVTLQMPADPDQKMILYTCSPDTAIKLTTLLSS
ncbi:XRE family transcriptional regulator [Paenibacillus psychroresistens]|uniref:XRE family transcriptional regulator n=2 Tax=Paenibacillus psychroresistens TaxID=1778678 RepID=A0A6B8RZE5_9BACL|nr:XRE family transcriptional regulator [Paenibacillus psychroresistens]